MTDTLSSGRPDGKSSSQISTWACQVQRSSIYFVSLVVCPHYSHFLLLCFPKDRKQGCVAMLTGIFAGLWDILDCTSKQKYICKKAAEGALVTTVPPTTPALSCESGWTPVAKRNVCFKVSRTNWAESVRNLCDLNYTKVILAHVLHQKLFKKKQEYKKTWHEALEFCRAIGGDLMSIHSSQDLNNAQYVDSTEQSIYGRIHMNEQLNHECLCFFCSHKGLVLRTQYGLASAWVPVKVFPGAMGLL